MKRLIVTDSTADIPANIVKKLGIEVLPVNVVLNRKTYKDGVNINIVELYGNVDSNPCWLYPRC